LILDEIYVKLTDFNSNQGEASGALLRNQLCRCTNRAYGLAPSGLQRLAIIVTSHDRPKKALNSTALFKSAVCTPAIESISFFRLKNKML